MSNSQHAPHSGPLEQTREQTIDALCEHFADDRLNVEDLEQRVDAAHKARSHEELQALLRDLPTAPTSLAKRGSTATEDAPGYRVADAEGVKDRSLVLAIMGGTGRKGRWTPARHNLVMAVMGGAELDFREAAMPPGVTEIQVYTFWGGVEIIVPPDVHVESTGFAVLGGFEHAAEDAVEPRSGAPTLRITGVAVMGGVDVTVRRPGETARDARRRRRLERKEQRKRLG